MTHPLHDQDWAAASVETRFAVPDMHCAGCIAKIERMLPQQPGITGARVNFSSRTVAVRSMVERDYAERREADPERTETYVFMRGQYFKAFPESRYLAQMDFRTIVKTLAGDLRKNHYEPAASFLTADLVLVVHWGATQPAETPAGQFMQDFDMMREAANALEAAHERMADVSLRGVVDTASEVSLAQADLRRESTATITAGTRDAPRRQSNAELLGLQAAMWEEDQAVFSTSLGETLRQMVNEERYFIVVMAYDAAAMREGRKKRVWSTRASIRGPGVNFVGALDRLSHAAGEYHGRRQNGIEFKPLGERKMKEAVVEIGELQVLGEEPPKPEPAPPAETPKNP